MENKIKQMQATKFKIDKVESGVCMDLLEVAS